VELFCGLTPLFDKERFREYNVIIFGLALQPDNVQLAKRLLKHREHLLRFLYVHELDATSNQAERQLRPAVITRKTTGCNRFDEGAETHSVLPSVLTTCHQRGVPILDFLSELQRETGILPSLGSLQPAPT
jgi:hypothetical protein